MRSDAFRAAAERMDLDATMATMSGPVTLRSPVVPAPFEGRDSVRKVFAVLYELFEELAFVETYSSDEGGEILEFRWRIGEHEAEGVDVLHFDDAGLIDDYRVMVRPLPALQAMSEQVFARLQAS
jgi:hypothetical protein